jgi:hypothetical protein
MDEKHKDFIIDAVSSMASKTNMGIDHLNFDGNKLFIECTIEEAPIDPSDEYIERFTMILDAIDNMPLTVAKVMLNNALWFIDNEFIIKAPANVSEMIKERIKQNEEFIKRIIGKDKTGFS